MIYSCCFSGVERYFMGFLVLFVEDNEDLWDIVSEALEKEVVEFLPARSLNEAKQLFLDHKGQLSAITMDGNLTDGATPDLVRFIREQGFLGPVIATSGNDNLQKLLMLSGCSHNCMKPRCVATLLIELLGLEIKS